VIGTDLSPIQPQGRNITNCEFIVEDSEKDWVFPNIKFDYVHFRMTFTCFDDPRKVLYLAYENLNPGGWIEYQDSIFQPGRMGGTAEGMLIA
jgi:ubiquinone/menaquinone biosynthesis C-methylase UbiE